MNRRELIKAMLSGLVAAPSAMALVADRNAAVGASLEPVQVHFMEELNRNFVPISITYEAGVGGPSITTVVYGSRERYTVNVEEFIHMIRHGKPIDFQVTSEARELDVTLLGTPGYLYAVTTVTVRYVGCED
jgi:hypothetical protein